MEWTVWNTILLYLTLGAIVGLAMHQITLEAMNRQADGAPHSCEIRRTLGAMLHETFEGLPNQAHPMAAVLLWIIWAVVWPLVIFLLIGLWAHSCEDECSPNDLGEDPHQ